MFTLLLAAAWAEECSQRPTDLDVRGIANQAEQAFAQVDPDGFAAAHLSLTEALRCLAEPITPSTAAKAFLIEGLHAHLSREQERVSANLAAFAELESLAPPSSVAPEGHAVREAWKAAVDAGVSPRRPLPVPEGGRIWIDGSETLDLPEERPTIVQMVVDGEVTWTTVVQPGTDPPSYPEAPEAMREAYRTATIETKNKHPWALVAITSVLAAGAIGTYVATTQTRAAFKDPDRTAAADLPSARRTNNALVLTSIGLGVAAGGVGVATVVAW